MSKETEEMLHKISVEKGGAGPKKIKAVYIGAPACFALEQACQHINQAFDSYGCYVVGSSLERQDWRDVDVRMIMEDSKFHELFPNASPNGGSWEFDSRWLLLTVSISLWLSKMTGLPVDFQIQPQSHANSVHKGRRNAVGLKIIHSKDVDNNGKV